MMSQKKIITEAFTEMAPHYEEKVSSELDRFWGMDYTGFVDRLIQLAQIVEGEVVLDIATGTAVIPRRLLDARVPFKSIHGLDITPAMLRKARQKLEHNHSTPPVQLSCGSAMELPFRSDYFDLVFCGLATHHLSVPQFLAQVHRVLKPGGRLAIGDVAGSPIWQLPGISHAIRAAAFLYFLPGEGFARASSEAAALSNVYSAPEWKEALALAGFSSIQINYLTARHSWIPAPLIIRAQKPAGEI
ncbi:MAG: methyltransferase domain-containing protein [Chloroflexi bacterium]|nr:methyltransferase domain-containing protein [Chloroflexota bacterium]